MKKIFFIAALVLAGVAGTAQTSFTAVIPGTEDQLKGSIEKMSLTFEIENVTDAKQVDLLNNKATPYVKEISVQVKLSIPQTAAVVVATLNDGAGDMRWLFRYFVNAGITQVKFNGKTLPTQEFFKPWL